MSASPDSALSPRLHLITGKGGVGRTSVAVALARAFAERGERVLLLEAADDEGTEARPDQPSPLALAFGEALKGRASLPSASAPLRVPLSPLTEGGATPRGSVYVGQLVAREGHELFLRSLLPVERLIKAALSSQALSRFLGAAPSMYELGLFYHLWRVTEDARVSKVVIDLPATGHTLALTRLPDQLTRMVRRGPVVEALQRGKEVLTHPQRASVWVVALPERLPVSEALDLSRELERDGFPTAGFVLNRTPLLSLSEEARAQLHACLQETLAEGVAPVALSELERVSALSSLRAELEERAPVLPVGEARSHEGRALEVSRWWGSPWGEAEHTPAEHTHDHSPHNTPLQHPNPISALINPDDASLDVLESLKQRLLTSKTIVCCGAGGVGKTTTSAALALAGAQLGRRVLVLTIDPSKRLAQALGVARNTPRPVELSAERLERLGVTEGSLSAWLLDPQLVSDGVVKREAREQASALMGNMIYREVSGMVAGMQEYTAVEALRSFVHDDRYDLIVLDTPPSRHALRFLDAPERVASFLDKRIFKLFTPRRTGLMGRLAGRALDEVLERAFGAEVSAELKEFFELFGGILDHLNEHQQEMGAFFKGPDVCFYLVTTAGDEVVEEARSFAEQARARGLPFGGVVLNRDPRLYDLSAAQRASERLADRLSARDLPLLAEWVQARSREAEGRRSEVEASHARLTQEGAVMSAPDLGAVASELEGLAQLAGLFVGASRS
jgi:anion-transporting  ArsA/GET3 family ATPase